MQVTVAKGENLAQALGKLNIDLPMNCGGKGICNSCMVNVKGFGKVRACKFRIPGTYEVSEYASAKYTVVGLTSSRTNGLLPNAQNGASAADRKSDGLRVAVDLGTTTIAMTGIKGNKTVTIGFLNPERAYGADVVSRIQAATEHGEAIRELIQDALIVGSAKCRELLAIEGTESDTDTPVDVVVSANTTMQYLLWGYDTAELGRAPFAASHLQAHVEHTDGITWTALPGISAFVGSDIVSGAIACDLDRTEELTLFLDLGTNGEMLLGCKDHWMATATAAGPAFEGSPVARLVHASGVLKILHHLREQGTLDETGLLSEPYFTEGYAIDSEGLFTEHAVLTQEDIRQIQMAKAATRAGIAELVKAYGTSLSSIKKVVLAGGMGYFIEEADAVAIGLLPEEFRGKTISVGNSSLSGAVKTLLEKGILERQQQFVGNCKAINLANIPGFAEAYISYMNL